MQRTLGPLAALRRAMRTRPDEGLSMVELLMAIVIFGIAASAIMGGFLTALKSTRSDRNRIQASNLASRELEITRNEFFGSSAGPANLQAADYLVNPHQLPGGTAGAALVVDRTPYTVVRDVEPLVAGTGVSPCDGGTAVQYPQFQVNVTVTWAAMAGVKPVTQTTVLTPPKGTIANSYGYVAVKVVDSTSSPSPGRSVTITGPGGTDTDSTGADGCAVFPEATAGNYTVSLNDSGYVDIYGQQNPSKPATVTAGLLTQVQPFNYDKKARLDVTLSTDAGYGLPTGYNTIKPTVVIANTNLQPLGVKATVLSGSNAGPIDLLYPYPDGYAAWVGSCSQSDPVATGGTRGVATIIAPGANGATTIRLAPVQVTLKNILGVPVVGATIVAVPGSATGCLAGENPLTLGVTDSTGTLKTSFPAGAWTLQASGHAVSGTWPSTGNLQATTAPTAVAVTVVS